MNDRENMHIQTLYQDHRDMRGEKHQYRVGIRGNGKNTTSEMETNQQDVKSNQTEKNQQLSGKIYQVLLEFRNIIPLYILHDLSLRIGEQVTEMIELNCFETERELTNRLEVSLDENIRSTYKNQLDQILRKLVVFLKNIVNDPNRKIEDERNNIVYQFKNILTFDGDDKKDNKEYKKTIADEAIELITGKQQTLRISINSFINQLIYHGQLNIPVGLKKEIREKIYQTIRDNYSTKVIHTPGN